MNQQDEIQNIIDFLIANRREVKELLSDLNKQKLTLLEQHPNLRKDIDDQFKYAREISIIDYLDKNLSTNVFNVRMVLASMDMERYLAEDIIDVDNLSDKL